MIAAEEPIEDEPVSLALVDESSASFIEKLDTARQLLAETHDFDIIKQVRDLAEAARLYARQQELSNEAVNYAAEIKIRAERRLGELLKNTPRNKGGRPSKTPDSVSVVSPPLEKELGISWKQASRWQAMADLPQEEFEAHIEETRKKGIDLTTASVQQIARPYAQAARLQERLREVGVQPEATFSVEGITCEINQCDAKRLPLPDGVVDLIVTSPPYNLGKDYPNVEDDKAYQVYLTDVELWSLEMHRIAKVRGRLCLNIPLDISRGGLQPIYSDWLNCLLDAGWKYKCSIVWNEGNVSKSVARGSIDSPVAPNIFAPVEMIIVCYKDTWNLGRGGQHTLGHEEWLNWTNGLWTFPGENRNLYPGSFPEELPKRCISLLSFSDAVVCDPFVGSGTSAVAAVRAGRTFYGFDISEEAVNIARSRIALMAAV